MKTHEELMKLRMAWILANEDAKIADEKALTAWDTYNTARKEG
jgi:hypothetical protein